jgi:hypothetical protein
LACLYIVAGFSPFFPFFLFFSVFLCSACRGGSCPVLACCGSWSVAGGLTSLYVPFGRLWQAVALVVCFGFLAGVFTLSRVAVCRCCRFCRFVCVCDCVAVCVCLYRWQTLALSRCACIPVRLSNKCSTRGVRTSFRNKCSTVNLGQSVRISNRIQPNFCQPNLEFFQPNPDRIGISQSSTESLIGLLPRLALHDRWAAARRLVGSPGTMWSACQGSLSLGPSLQRWQT